MSGVPPWSGSLISEGELVRLMAEITRETGVSSRQILSEDRTKHIAHARQYGMWKMRQIAQNGHPKFTLTEIGFAFGRSHWTVMHAIERVEQRMAAQKAAA